MPKPDADLCMRVNLPLDKKLGNQDWAIGSMGLRASGLAGPSGRRAGVSSRAGGRGPSGLRAAGPSQAVGRRAGGPSRAVGRGPLGLRAAGPLGRRGPRASGRWAAGLLLAKPVSDSLPLLQLNYSLNSFCSRPETNDVLSRLATSIS